MLNTNFFPTKIATPIPETPSKSISRGGLAGSKFAEELDDEPVIVEGEKDNSSAALASVRYPFPNVFVCS